MLFALVALDLPEDPPWPDLGDVTYHFERIGPDGASSELARVARSQEVIRIDLFGRRADWEAELQRRMTEQLSQVAGLTVRDIRKLLDTSRKYAIPILEQAVADVEEVSGTPGLIRVTRSFSSAVSIAPF